MKSLIILFCILGMVASSRTFEIISIAPQDQTYKSKFYFSSAQLRAYMGAEKIDSWGSNNGADLHVYQHRFNQMFTIYVQMDRGVDMAIAYHLYHYDPVGGLETNPLPWMEGEILTIVGTTADRIPVYSNDRNGQHGEYFNFMVYHADELLRRTDWNQQQFMALRRAHYTQKTDKMVEVQLFREPNLSSNGKGDAFGRREPFNIKSTSDWQVGNEIFIVEGFKVKSIDHADTSDGYWFNFMAFNVDASLNRTNWNGEKFTVYNQRLGRTVSVKMYRKQTTGTNGQHLGLTCYGRKSPLSSISQFDWQVGDVLTIVGGAMSYRMEPYSQLIGKESFFYAFGAYCKKEDIENWHYPYGFGGKFNHVKFDTAKVINDYVQNLQAFVGYDWAHERVVISFRGTEVSSWHNIATDLSIMPVKLENAVNFYKDETEKLVHQGFYDAFKNLEGKGLTAAVVGIFDAHPGADVFCTGHSLGGALATIVALELIISPSYNELDVGNVDVVTFGSPRVLNEALAKKFNENIRTSWRIVNRNDPVPTLPEANFHHVGTKVWYYHGTKSNRPTFCDGTGEDPQCTLHFPPFFLDHTAYQRIFGFDDDVKVSLCRPSS